MTLQDLKNPDSPRFMSACQHVIFPVTFFLKERIESTPVDEPMAGHASPGRGKPNASAATHRETCHGAKQWGKSPTQFRGQGQDCQESLVYLDIEAAAQHCKGEHF